MKKLTDIVIGFIYEYYRTDNDEVVYIGSSEHKDDKWGEPLSKVDKWHREGHLLKSKYRYSWTHFRSTLRTEFGKKVQLRFLHEPQEMSRKQMLTLEGESIRMKQQVGECYLNHTPDPLKTFEKYNKL